MSASWDIDEVAIAANRLVSCCVETQVSLTVAAVRMRTCAPRYTLAIEFILGFTITQYVGQ